MSRRVRTTTLACLTLVGFFGVSSWEGEAGARQPDLCKKQVRQARRLLLNGEAESAIEQLAGLLERSGLTGSCRGDALQVLAQAEERLGRFEEAIEQWRALLERQPKGRKREDVLEGVARVARKLGRPEESLKALEELARLKPRSIRVVLQVIQSYREMGDDLGAAKRLVEFRSARPDIVEFEYYSRLRLGREATRYLEILDEAGQASEFELIELSRLQFSFGDREASLKTALALQKGNPDSSEIQALVGSLRLMRGELDLAMESYERSLDQGGDSNPDFVEGLGEIFFRRGDRKKAIQIWRRMGPKTEGRAFQKLRLVRIYRDHGLHDEALALLLELKKEKSGKLPPSLFLRQLADTYYIVGKPRTALAELVEMAEANPLQLDIAKVELQRMLSEEMSLCELLEEVVSGAKTAAGYTLLAGGLEFCGKNFAATRCALKGDLLLNRISAIESLFSKLVTEERFEEAAWLEQRLLQARTPSVHLSYFRGRLAQVTNRPQEADAFYRSYLAAARGLNRGLDRGLVDDALYHLAELAIGPLGQPAQGRRRLMQLVVDHPYSTYRPAAEAKIGLALYRQGRTEEALRHLDALGDTNPLALQLLGEIALAEGDFQQARVTLRQALSDYPEQEDSWKGIQSLLTVLRLSQGDDAEKTLVAEYRKVLLLGATATAELPLQRLTASKTWGDFARSELARLYANQGRMVEAASLYALLCSTHGPGWLATNAALELSKILVTQGRGLDAIHVLEQAILDQPESPKLPQLRHELEQLRKAEPPPRELLP